jgi:hypothetical protein
MGPSGGRLRACLFVCSALFLPVRSLSLRLRFVRFCVSLSDRVLPCTTLYYPVLPCTTLYYDLLVWSSGFVRGDRRVCRSPSAFGLFVCSFAASLLCRLARRFEPSPGLVPKG